MTNNYYKLSELFILAVILLQGVYVHPVYAIGTESGNATSLLDTIGDGVKSFNVLNSEIRSSIRWGTGIFIVAILIVIVSGALINIGKASHAKHTKDASMATNAVMGNATIVIAAFTGLLAIYFGASLLGGL